MNAPHIHRTRPAFSAKSVLEKLGRCLGTIRDEDGLTWTDIGRHLGKHRDRAAAYADGDGDMGVVSFLMGCREWNGRFANDALAMIGMKLVPLDGASGCDRSAASALTRLLLEMSVALEDGEISELELAAMRRSLDEAASAVDGMRAKLAGMAA